MSLNINKNFASISNHALASLNKHQSVMGKAITRVSTGMRVNSPADDASAYMTAKKIEADSAGYTALANGIQTSSAKLNAADSQASSVLDILNSMKAKALEYISADSGAQTTINQEFKNLVTVLNSALGVQYNSSDLANNSVTAYNAIYSSTKLSDITTSEQQKGKISASWDLADVISSALTNSIISSGAITSSGTDTIVTALTDAISSVVAQQGSIGAALEALDYSASFLNSMANAQDTAYTSITEADMAKEMTTYVRNNVLAQASQAMIAQANQSMAQVLNLLQ